MPPESWAVLTRALDLDVCTWIGFANGGPPGEQMSHAGRAITAQCAPQIVDFEGGVTGQPRRFHSIRTVLRGARLADAAFSERFVAQALSLGLDPGDPTDELLTALALLHRHWPDAGLILFTSDAARLARLLAGAAQL